MLPKLENKSTVNRKLYFQNISSTGFLVSFMASYYIKYNFHWQRILDF